MGREGYFGKKPPRKIGKLTNGRQKRVTWRLNQETPVGETRRFQNVLAKRLGKEKQGHLGTRKLLPRSNEGGLRMQDRSKGEDQRCTRDGTMGDLRSALPVKELSGVQQQLNRSSTTLVAGKNFKNSNQGGLWGRAPEPL